jgi:hypothetical protein
MIPVRIQIRDKLGGKIGKVKFGRIKYKFKTSRNKNSNCVQYIGTSGGCIPQGNKIITVLVTQRVSACL